MTIEIRPGAPLSTLFKYATDNPNSPTFQVPVSVVSRAALTAIKGSIPGIPFAHAVDPVTETQMPVVALLDGSVPRITFDTGYPDNWIVSYGDENPKTRFYAPHAMAVDALENMYALVLDDDVGLPQVVKIAPNGDKIWTKQYAPSVVNGGYGGGIAIAPDGNLILALGTHNTSYELHVLKITPDGAILWQKTYNEAGADLELVLNMKVDASGNIYLAGPVKRLKSLIKLSPTGDILWYRVLSAYTPAYFTTALALDGSGNVAVLVEDVLSDTNRQPAIYKFTPAGDLMWSRRYNPPGTTQNHIVSSMLGYTGQGHYVFGVTNPTDGWSHVVAVSEATGEVVWTKKINGKDINGYANVISYDGPGFAIAGLTATDDYYIACLDYTGAMQWEMTFGTVLPEYTLWTRTHQMLIEYPDKNTFGLLGGGDTPSANSEITIARLSSQGDGTGEWGRYSYSYASSIVDDPVEATTSVANALPGGTLALSASTPAWTVADIVRDFVKEMISTRIVEAYIKADGSFEVPRVVAADGLARRVSFVYGTTLYPTGQQAGWYFRFVSTGEKTFTVRKGFNARAPMEFVVANRSTSGNLTLAGDGFTLNAPAGGSLVLVPGATATLKIVSDTEVDVFV